MWCLPKTLAAEFIRRFSSGEITPDKLIEMKSEGRHKYFASFLGELNATKVNTMLESKLLLKNKQQGIINWAKQVTRGRVLPKELVQKVASMKELLDPQAEEDFYADIAAQRLGTRVTREQSDKLVDLSSAALNARNKIDRSSPDGSVSRLEYGKELVAFKRYAAALMEGAKSHSLKEATFEDVADVTGGTLKALNGSMDNSFNLRQGYKILFERPDIWANNLKESWKDIAKELKGKDPMLVNQADVFSRENALNGTYQALGLDIGLAHEEAIPTSLPQKIPLIGKFFRASETAYNGSALRLRADMADAWIREAKSQGVDVMDKDSNIGTVINSLTGRGKIDVFNPKGSKITNALLFSAKYAKSVIDSLTAPVDYYGRLISGRLSKESAFARRKAAHNTLKMMGSIMAMLIIAKKIDDESADLDPRSSDFGKIKLGRNHNFPVDVTAGLGGLTTLASRLIPTKYNGEWGGWIKNRNGQYYNWWDDKFGSPDGLTLATNWITGKASPLASMLLAYATANHMQKYREKQTPTGKVLGAISPISSRNLWDIIKHSEDEEALLMALIAALEVHGAGTNYREQ